MKIKSLLLVLTLTGCAASLGAAEKTVAGPKGGRLLAAEPQPAEFFVDAGRKVVITFYDAALHPAAPSTQVVTVTAEPPAGKAPVELVRTPDGFISTAGLPAGEPYRVVVQVRATPDAKPRNFRIDFNPALCSECKHAEYACTCESH